MPKQENKLWKEACSHLEKVTGKSSGSGNKHFTCKFCSHSATGTLLKLQAHLAGEGGYGIAGCTSCPPEKRAEIRALRGWKGVEVQSIGGAGTSLNPQVSSPSPTSLPPHCLVNPPLKRKRGSSIENVVGCSSASIHHEVVEVVHQISPMHLTMKQSTLSRTQIGWQKKWMELAEMEVGKMLIECNLPFRILDTPSWKQMVETLTQVGKKTAGPSSTTLKRKLIPMAHEEIARDITKIEQKWSRYGCTLMTDGWVDMRKRGLYNVMLSSAFGTIYKKSYDMSGAGVGVTGDLFYDLLYEKMKEVIDEVGPHNIVQVITDNGSNSIAMGKLLEETYKTLVWTPCASHSLNLLLKDIAALPWIKKAIGTGEQIVTLFARKKKALAIYRMYATKELLKPAKTRFGSRFIMIHRLVEVWDALRQTVVSKEWNAWRDRTLPESEAIQLLVLDTTNLMDFRDITEIIRPIYSVLRLTDREGATIGLLYEFMNRIKEVLDKRLEDKNASMKYRIEEIRNKVTIRWDWFFRPIHAVAHLLHPLWRDGTTDMNKELRSGWVTYLVRIFDGDHEKADKLYDDLLQFRGKMGEFNNPMAESRRAMSKPVSWWEKYGGCTPELQKLALRVLSQDCSTGAVERNWSAHSLIHTKRRNKLKTSTMHDLIYCRENLRALRKYKMLKEPKQVDPNEIDVYKNPELPPINHDEEELYRILFLECSGTRRSTRGGGRGIGSSSTPGKEISEEEEEEVESDTESETDEDGSESTSDRGSESDDEEVDGGSEDQESSAD